MALSAAAGAGNLSGAVTLVAFYLSGGVAVGTFALAYVSASGATVATEAATALTVGTANLFIAVAELAFAVAVVAEIALVGDAACAFAVGTWFAANG